MTDTAPATDESFHEQRDWLLVTLSSIGDAVITTDGEGRVTFLNPVAATLTGWAQREAVAGRPRRPRKTADRVGGDGRRPSLNPSPVASSTSWPAPQCVANGGRRRAGSDGGVRDFQGDWVAASRGPLGSGAYVDHPGRTD